MTMMQGVNDDAECDIAVAGDTGDSSNSNNGRESNFDARRESIASWRYGMN